MSPLSGLSKLGAVVGVFAVVALASENKSDGQEPAGRGSAAGAGGSTVAEIPAEYLAQYRESGDTCPELDWALLAGLGKVETNHGRSNLSGVHSGSNSAGAKGPMQFLGSTFTSVRAQHADVGSDPYDPADAIPAAAHYLCDSGLRAGNEYRAIYSYNHAGWYVSKVRAQASAYRAAA